MTTNVIKFFTLCWCCTYYDNSIVHCLPILFFQRRHRRVLAESQHQYNHTGLSLPKVSMNPSFHTSSFGNHYNAHNPSASTVSLLPSLSSTYKAPKVPHVQHRSSTIQHRSSYYCISINVWRIRVYANTCRCYKFKDNLSAEWIQIDAIF